MENNQIVILEDYKLSRQLREFIEAIEQLDLHFSSTSLEHVYGQQDELEFAIERAIRVCNSLGMPLHKHFRKRFVSNIEVRTLKTDWNMSKLANSLTLMNGNPDNPMVSRMQLEILKRMIV